MTSCHSLLFQTFFLILSRLLAKGRRVINAALWSFLVNKHKHFKSRIVYVHVCYLPVFAGALQHSYLLISGIARCRIV